MAKYKRINLMEREEISRQIASGCNLRKIAKSLNRAPRKVC